MTLTSLPQILLTKRVQIMRVDVSGRSFIFPRLCACCGVTADRELAVSATRSWGKRVRHSETKAWDIPYCATCVQHVGAAASARTLAVILGCASVLAGGVVAAYVEPSTGVVMGIAAMVGTVFLFKRLMSQARSLCHANCACVGKAVAYLGWYGSLHQFDIASRQFAHDFMAANQNKLVNLSTEAQSLLASTGSTIGPSTARSPRRYIT